MLSFRQTVVCHMRKQISGQGLTQQKSSSPGATRMQVAAKVAAAEEPLRAHVVRLEGDLRAERIAIASEQEGRRQHESAATQQAHSMESQIAQLQSELADCRHELKMCVAVYSCRRDNGVELVGRHQEVAMPFATV